MSLIGKTIKFDTDKGVLEGIVIDKVIGWYTNDPHASTRYLVETKEGARLSIVPYHKVLNIIKPREIPNVPEADRVNFNNRLPGIIPKSSWPAESEYPQSDL